MNARSLLAAAGIKRGKSEAINNDAKYLGASVAELCNYRSLARDNARARAHKSAREDDDLVLLSLALSLACSLASADPRTRRGVFPTRKTTEGDRGFRARAIIRSRRRRGTRHRCIRDPAPRPLNHEPAEQRGNKHGREDRAEIVSPLNPSRKTTIRWA